MTAMVMNSRHRSSCALGKLEHVSRRTFLSHGFSTWAQILRRWLRMTTFRRMDSRLLTSGLTEFRVEADWYSFYFRQGLRGSILRGWFFDGLPHAFF